MNGDIETFLFPLCFPSQIYQTGVNDLSVLGELRFLLFLFFLFSSFLYPE